MKCPVCGAESQVLETRGGHKADSTMRRRECQGSVRHRFNTYEVYASEFLNVQSKVKQYAAARTRRITSWQRDDQIAKDGRPTREVAAEAGITPCRVRQIRRTHT